MKPKLLFWIDPVFISYALAKSIQDEKNCDLFAIIDITDKPKRFFQNQKIVSFKKQWFFHDFIFKKKHVLGLDYLRSIEKKYDLPLTLFLSNDRFF